MKALHSIGKKNRRLLGLTAAFVLTDLIRGKKPAKTAVKLAAAHGRSGVRTLKKKGMEKAENSIILSAASKAASAKDPKEIRHRKLKKKLFRFLIRKLA